MTELSSVIKDKDKEQKILNAKELLLVRYNSLAELKIMVCHRPFSDPFQCTTKQSPIW